MFLFLYTTKERDSESENAWLTSILSGQKVSTTSAIVMAYDKDSNFEEIFEKVRVEVKILIVKS